MPLLKHVPYSPPRRPPRLLLFCAAPSPNTQCYASAITACARAHDPRSAMRLLADMREDGVSPNDVVLNAAVDACGKVT